MHRGSFRTTPMIQNAPRFILDHPDGPPDHPDAILHHRDAVLDGRNPSSDPRKRLLTALEHRKSPPDRILDGPDPACDQTSDTFDTPEGAPECIAMTHGVSERMQNWSGRVHERFQTIPKRLPSIRNWFGRIPERVTMIQKTFGMIQKWFSMMPEWSGVSAAFLKSPHPAS